MSHGFLPWDMPQAGQPLASVVPPVNLRLSQWLYVLSQQEVRNKAPNKNEKRQKVPALCIASWNVQTTTTGLHKNVQQIDHALKLAVIDSIAALQETRQAKSGSLKETEYTFIWQGKVKKTNVSMEWASLRKTCYHQQ